MRTIRCSSHLAGGGGCLPGRCLPRGCLPRGGVYQARKHSSRMRTAHFPIAPVWVAASRCQYLGVDISTPGIPTPDTYFPPGYLPPAPQNGPGTRDTTPQKGLGTRDTYLPLEGSWDQRYLRPVDRHMPVKTLPSHNYCCGW